LASGILNALNEAVPEKLGFPGLRARLPEYSTRPDQELFLCLDALRKENLIRGTFYERGFNKILHGAVNLEITSSGRQKLGRIDLVLTESLRNDVDQLTQLLNRGDSIKTFKI
jgi:hypothetical protein